MTKKTVYSTGEVAKFLHVAPRTVCKWFDQGRLRGYRHPNTKDRRIPVEALVEFCREHGFPLPAEITMPNVETGGGAV